jgi:hypothetical protein
MLEITDLWVNIEDKEVLKGINLRVPVGETHILWNTSWPGVWTKKKPSPPLSGVPQRQDRGPAPGFGARNGTGHPGIGQRAVRR